MNTSNKNLPAETSAAQLTLGIPGFAYADLYDSARLQDLTAVFNARTQANDPDGYQALEGYRCSGGEGLTPEQISEVIVRVASHVGDFIAELFQVRDVRAEQQAETQAEFDSIFAFRTEIVGKLAARFKGVDISSWHIDTLRRQFKDISAALIPLAQRDADLEKAVAALALQIHLLVSMETPDADAIAKLRNALSVSTDMRELSALDDAALLGTLHDLILRWSYAATQDNALKHDVSDWVSFKTPEKTDFNHLVEHETIERGGYKAWGVAPEHQRRRDGFALTDPRFPLRKVLYEVDHCIYCHDRDTDSCSKGMRNKKDGSFKTNPLGVTNSGCPLEEKISEMHVLKRRGDNIAALAIVAIDNPMCPGTGHRICNDCMRGCIYQKTEPVNIPQIETNVLTSVLFMPWGFEIYSLLTRWNPLNVKRPVALAYNGKNVLVAGMGPAGYTLSHYLLNEGFGVVGIDGLKIEPLPPELVGNADTPPRPVFDFNELYEDLDKRVMLGFGGVAEYGITVRWDKNFLKVIYLNLLRRAAFRCYGGVRFGGTLTVNEAWDIGFDHIAIASGAGKPTVIDLKNNLTRGIRKASDFLMALQLSGAAKESTLANLQVRLPAGVIGGGLTAIDTATELLAYYPVQVEKILHRYQKLVGVYGEDSVRANYDSEELLILDEFLGHGRVIQDERARAAAAGEKPHFQPLLAQWGGVTMFYRKGIKDSPAYRQNHEEIAEALDEGIWLAEGMSPLEALEDQYGHLSAVVFETLEEQEGRWRKTGEREIALRSLFVAAGTSPNTIYESEHPDTFVMDKKFYQRHEPQITAEGYVLAATADRTEPKIGKPAPFTSYQRNGRYITFYGDNHPVYAGNVVKAMASAKHGYPYIVDLFARVLAAQNDEGQAERDKALTCFQQHLDSALRAQIVSITRLTPTIIEVLVKAPLAAKHFRPGQFYRVQNYEALAPVREGTVLATEGLALTGAWVDKEHGLISLITLEMGSSSRLLATWNPGDALVVMGVTGTPTDIPSGQTVLLLGGGLGNAVLFSIGKALRTAGNQVIYFAGYRSSEDVFKAEEIEAASDLIVWSVDNRPGNTAITPTRLQDKTFVGNIVEAMLAYARGELGATPIHLDDVDHIVVIGSDRMMAAVKEARRGVLAPYIKPHHAAIGSINSPMQCMMKGVCAQCLCKHIDPETGAESFVYSCNNQDQDLDRVDFPNLHARLRQNSVQEKLSSLWLNYLLSSKKLETA
ncbi:pyridine nucleotide-disulfide oxidoreductase [Candidatus Methylospira mobilis]|uniref:pyridine nucleotide-disulfide oxidoreductase n=1 Tax=Candidatus Methylospira mobilis TaxID=1808979 RepID=UPI0028E978FA|nr:pyridine nucleotide-disulfide oxidoreductase [Candidatus Methylospira mobilis]WNV05717.1 pyridine nucleotide-disulfide oxidoreductase [Candidatus Methylospira mobilis]